MQLIELEDDLYQYLLSKTTYVGEPIGAILRRELKRGDAVATRKEAMNGTQHELSTFLSSPSMRLGSVTDRFLAVLEEAYRQRPTEFEKVLSIQGRDRVYFARSRQEIAGSGRSTQPLQIADTPFWVMTNSPTPQKRRMLNQALEIMGYSQRARSDAARAIDLSLPTG